MNSAAAMVAIAIAWSAAAGAVTDPRTPEQVVEQTATELAIEVEANRAMLAANQQELYALVDQVLLPVFDTAYAGRLVLGRHARAATAEQRRQFVASFYHFLLRSYAENVLKFRKDHVQVLPSPSQQPADQQRVAVCTRMLLDDGSTISVDYSLRLNDVGWRIFDVRINGISYVQTYRNQFDAEISARGLDAVIARLQTEAAAP